MDERTSVDALRNCIRGMITVMDSAPLNYGLSFSITRQRWVKQREGMVKVAAALLCDPVAPKREASDEADH